MENFTNFLDEEKFKKVISGKNKSDIDKILRENIKYLTKLYFEYCKKGNNKRDYIPPSGKVLDEHELYNMIDASLDMWLTTGRFNDEFEKKLAEFVGVKYALTTNSGSSANLLAISALTSYKLGDRRLKEGDEVITVVAGFPTTVAPIIQNKLIPVFVDVELGTYNIDIKQIEEAISEKTKAIFVAHTLGNPFDIEKVLKLAERHNLWVIEDNCDALGAKYNGKYTGSFGHISTISFYPAHHITMGEGGAVLTNDYGLYKIVLSFRDWGRDCWCPPGKDDTCGRRFDWKLGNLPKGYDHKYIYSHLGYNLKITDWQAAIGLAQLDKLPEFIEKRKENFRLLYEGLKEFEEYLILPRAMPNSEPSWFGFPITVRDNAPFNKFELVKYLEENGIGTRQLFAGNMLRHPAFIETDIKLRIKNSQIVNSKDLSEEHYKLLPNTDKVMNGTFWMGVWPGIEGRDVGKILKIFNNFVRRF
ncbi:lipopolysaccharide biosynthesis protein RfbH [Deferribacter autotrophicus]|uniref:Lipopolysaccharide biosynthesis protein RfbH n=1 Tax=Deferribacter autotrophicus TaxID=500465 RepID=A0A5A8F0N3_9BACT|nr:lipopolysaccharide biosynthesis protein RfbH [Deferribacter autotrophicus]KAA0257628.1 lipopolysaccharide biosynthesis protein RfbH [Deferribacter autotrophicus]